MANSVKVTLTADDQATEIVRRLSAAVKGLAAQNKEAAASTNATAQAAGRASNSFNSMASAITGVAAAFGAIKVLGFVRDTITAADQIGKLSQKTGATTEALSVLGVAASTADLSMEELGNGMKFLSRSVTELQGGSQDIAAAFEALGLSAADLKGLSLDQVFVKIANAQSKFADGAGKTAALMKIFGRSGEELIPLLSDLADGGFEKARVKAEKLGLVLGRDATQAAQDFNDRMTDLKNAAAGLATRLIPLVEGITKMADKIVQFVEAHPDLAQFGADAFIAAAAATALAAGLGLAAVAALALGSAFIPIIGTIAGLAIIGGAVGVIAKKFNDAKKEAEALAKATQASGIANTNSKPPVPPLANPALVKAIREARLDAVKQAAKQELDETQAGLKQREQIEEASFAQGLISLQQFYAARRDITAQGIAAQVKELEKEKRALADSPLSENTDAARIKRTTDIAGIEAQIKKLKIDGATQALALTEQERVAVKALQDELLSFSAQIATATGNQIGAQQIAIDQAGKRLEEALKKAGGVTEDEINTQRNAFVQLLTDRAAFEENQRQGERAITDLGLARQKIQQQAAQGLISERDATAEIADVERSRIPTLQAIADRLQFFAESTKDPALIQAAQQFRQEFESIGKVVTETDLKLANLKDTLFDAAQSDLSQFLGDTISHVGSLSEAFRSLATSIVSSFQRVLGDIIASKAIESLRGIFDGGAKAAATVAQTTAASATTASAAALTTAGTFVASSAGALLGASGALDISAGGLASSGGILLGAAAALSAAASALAVAGIASAGLGFASGGYVRGPGSSTSDSIPARLSAGEFVIRASAVKRLGVPFLQSLNGARMPSLKRPRVNGLPGFATGGLVTNQGGGNANVSGEIALSVEATDGLLVKLLGTRGGIKALREAIGANPGAFKAALQIS
jgi:hypothetical protein